jgi:hypothetical protein
VTRHRALVLASLPSRCAVCSGGTAIRLVRGRLASGATTRGIAPCPHCVGLMPIVHLPFRTDVPRSAA